MIEFPSTWDPARGGRWPKPYLFPLFDYQFYTDDVGRFHASTARVRIVSAPARTSKSFSAAYDAMHWVFPEWEIHEGRLYPIESQLIWIVCPAYKQNKEFDYLWQELVLRRRLHSIPFEFERKTYNPKQGALEITIRWGESVRGEPIMTKIEGKSAQNPESLQSEEVDLAILSEAAEHDRMVWERMLATRCKYTIWPTTPKPKADWVHEYIDLAERDPGCGIEHFHFALDPVRQRSANPKYDWQRFEQERRKAASRTDTGRAEDDPWFAEQFLGMWTYEAERLLPFRWMSMPGRPSHVIDSLPDWFETSAKFIACDYGYNDPACALWFALGQDGTVILYREIYESKLDPLQFVERIATRTGEERVEYVVGDPKRPEVERFMRELGLPVYTRGKPGEISDRAAGAMRLVDLLSDDPDLGRPKFYVLSPHGGERLGCPKTLQEWKTLRRKPGVGANEWTNEAVVGADHSFDATRYFLMSRPRPSRAMTWDVNDMTRKHIRSVQRMERQKRVAGPPLLGRNPSLWAS